MKILIRDKSLKLYLASGNQWVANADDGWDFQVGVAAIDFARTLRLTDIELVYVFRDSRQNFTLPFEALGPPRESKSLARLTRSEPPGKDGAVDNSERMKQLGLRKLWFKLEELDGKLQSNALAFEDVKRKLRCSDKS